ncbi:MAG: 30S ribosomal protein S9 [Candidatus Woesearchaeota archaeon]|nr:MAG: 30S ribosomal protein S9 [Candidatus Woesearchaeota archaeon]
MNNIITSGRRKQSIAKATLKEGKGIVKINNVLLNFYTPEFARLKIMEPLILAGDVASKVDIDVTVKGGGIITQADAVRLAIGRAMVEYMPKLKEVYLNYDRQLLVADIRVKESAKPNHHGQARAKTQTSYR